MLACVHRSFFFFFFFSFFTARRNKFFSRTEILHYIFIFFFFFSTPSNIFILSIVQSQPSACAKKNSFIFEQEKYLYLKLNRWLSIILINWCVNLQVTLIASWYLISFAGFLSIYKSRPFSISFKAISKRSKWFQP